MKRFTLLLVAILPLLCTPTLTSAQTNKKESNPTNTIDSTTYNLNQIYANTEVIKKNTEPETAKKTLNVSKESLTVSEKSLTVSKKNYWIAIIALVVSVCTLWISTKTLKYQKLSTRNVNGNVQNAALTDLIRHLYRNVDCTVAMALRFRSKKNSKGSAYVKYPSEANLLKLKAEPERYVPDAGKMETRKEFYELRTLLRNYSEEIEVASKHLSTKGLKRKDFEADFDNILFKPLFLTSKINGLWQNLETNNGKLKLNLETNNGKLKLNLKTNNGKLNKDFFKLAIQIIVEEHLNKIGSFEKYQTEIVSHQDRADLLVAINDDNTFDLYTKKEGEENNSVKRGMEFLLRLGEDGEQKPTPCSTISISDIMAKWSKNGNAYKLLTEIRNYKTTDEMFDKLKITKEDKLRNVLLPYFEMLLCNGPVNVEELLTYMIKIDAILEMPKIGMISYV